MAGFRKTPVWPDTAGRNRLTGRSHMKMYRFISRRTFLQWTGAPALLLPLRTLAENDESAESAEGHYSAYRRGLINRHIARNGCFLQQVWLVESEDKAGADPAWATIARRTTERTADADGRPSGTVDLTLSPLLMDIESPERDDGPVVVGGGDNPFLEGGLALLCFAVEMLEMDTPLASSRSAAKRLFDFMLNSEVVDPDSGEGRGYLLRRRNWWSMPVPASLDEYCGVVLGAWFYLQAMDKLGDDAEQNRVRSYLDRLGKSLKADDYLIPLMGFFDTYGFADHQQTGRDVWAFQFPLTRIFKSALGTSHLAGTTIPDERGGTFESITGLSPKGLFERILDYAHDVSFISQLFGGKQLFYNHTMIVHGLNMLLVTQPNEDVREEIWEQARGFFTGSLVNGGLRNPYFGITWDAWARERNDFFAGDVPRKMYEPTRNPEGRLFPNLPLREPLTPGSQTDPNPPMHRIDVKNQSRQYLWGRTFLSNAPWNPTETDLLTAGIVVPIGPPEIVGRAVLTRWDAVALKNRRFYTIRSPIDSIVGEIGPQRVEQDDDDRLKASDAFYTPKTERGFYVESSGLRYMVCRALATYFGFMRMPEIDDSGIAVLPADGPSAGDFRRNTVLRPRDVRRTISAVRRASGPGSGDYDLIYPREDDGLADMRQYRQRVGRPVVRARTFGGNSEYDAAVAIFSRYGNTEVVARRGDRLYHFFRRNGRWSSGRRITSDARGVPGFAQGRFGSFGNFEVVTAREGGGFLQLYRDNDDSAEPWRETRFGDSDLKPEAVALIHSNYGNLEIVFRDDDRLYHMWRDGVTPNWSSPRLISTGVRGAPALIQSSGGTRGHFEVVVPARSEGLRHFFRDNDDPSAAWVENRKLTEELRGHGGDFDAAAIVERPNEPILDVFGATDGGRLYHFRRAVSERPTGPHDMRLELLERDLPNGGRPAVRVSLANWGSSRLNGLSVTVRLGGQTLTARWNTLPPGRRGEPRLLSFNAITCNQLKSFPIVAEFFRGSTKVATKQSSVRCLGGSVSVP